MRKLMKMTVIAAVAALLLCAAVSCASADERIYTSPAFTLPKEKVMDWIEGQPEVPVQDEEPEDLPPEPEDMPEDPDELPVEEEKPGDPAEEDLSSGDGTGSREEDEEPERSVMIFSSQDKVVTEGEMIYLTSKLTGFDDVEVSFQWQVDRGDGLGWVDVEGATRDKHMFVASKETIGYSWRLIVSVNE